MLAAASPVSQVNDYEKLGHHLARGRSCILPVLIRHTCPKHTSICSKTVYINMSISTPRGLLLKLIPPLFSH